MQAFGFRHQSFKFLPILRFLTPSQTPSFCRSASTWSNHLLFGLSTFLKPPTPAYPYSIIFLHTLSSGNLSWCANHCILLASTLFIIEVILHLSFFSVLHPIISFHIHSSQYLPLATSIDSIFFVYYPYLTCILCFQILLKYLLQLQ